MNKDKLKELDATGKPYTIYAEVLEDSALDQFINVMEQKYVVKGALMPDAHLGYSLPIGAVVATNGVIIPSYVGFDIGCGVCALKLNIKKELIDNHSEDIYNLIYEAIPTGFNKNITHTPTHITTDKLSSISKEISEKKQWRKALGTLGGNNHFVEIGYDENDDVWATIHSGSRGVGYGIATYYMILASNDPKIFEKEFVKTHEGLKKHNPEKYNSYLSSYIRKNTKKLKPKEGNYGLSVTSEEGKDYINDLAWCLDYALENRKEMMRRVITVISDVIGSEEPVGDVEVGLINRNHNHAELKDGLWIHRKGATHAEEGMLGVIPGNMRDGSFIVCGRGNPESLYSSSHGAGRVMSRKEAKRKLTVDNFKDMMGGVQAKIDEDTLDECPSAYKDIFEVMRLQEELVDVKHHIKPIINIKG